MSQETSTVGVRPSLRVAGYLSVRAAAQWLGIRERSVRKLIELERLPSSRLGRMHFIPVRQVESYRAERRLRLRRRRINARRAA
jgi:excisionase family DNA binding protein